MPVLKDTLRFALRLLRNTLWKLPDGIAVKILGPPAM
jgi:hypothetical protein